MKTTPDFLKEAKVEIGQETMHSLETLIKFYDIAKRKVAIAEEELAEVKKHFNELALTRIPEFLLSHGISKMVLSDGREVTIKEDISATVSDDAAFRQWLRERKEEDIIKIKYAFAKMSSEQIASLSDFLLNNDYDYDIDENIHAQTKKKYFKELLKEIGREELPEWVSIYDIRQAVIK